LLEGKITLPIIHCLRNATQDERHLIESAMRGRRQDTSELGQVTALIERSGSIEYSKSLADLQVELALKSLNFLPETLYKELLCDFARSAVSRDR